MALALQLSLLESNDEFSLLCREDTKLDEKIENYRKSTFAANEHLTKCITAQEQEILRLKMFLVERCGATMLDLTPVLEIKAKRPRKKSKVEHPTFPGL